MTKISEIVKNEPAYPDADFVKVDTLIGKNLVIKGFAERQGEKGKFFVINADVDGNDTAFSCGGKVIVEKLESSKESFKLESDDNNVVKFPETVEGKLIYPQTKDGINNYYDLE